MIRLFKYTSDPRNIFTEGYIRLTQVNALNDPFEAIYCRDGLRELAYHFNDEHVYDEEYILDQLNKVGVISFSQNKENLLMWSHYANEHKGIIIGISQFDGENIFENLFQVQSPNTSYLAINYPLIDGIARPVTYRKGLRYRNDKFDYDYSNISVDGCDYLVYEILMQKSEEWIYEQEYRIVLKLSQADRVITKVDPTNIITPHTLKIIEDYSCISTMDDNFIIDLWKINDSFFRSLIASKLAELSDDLDTLFLMKLSKSNITSCLIGLKSPLTKDDIPIKAMRFSVWKAKKNLDYYSLEFDEI